MARVVLIGGSFLFFSGIGLWAPSLSNAQAQQLEASLADPTPSSILDSDRARRTRDLAWLSEESDLAFVGLLSVSHAETDERGIIFTRAQMEIEEILKGDPAAASVELTVLGGTHGGRTMHVSGSPKLLAGQRYIVFAIQQESESLGVLAGERGLFLLQESDDSVYTYSGESVVAVEGGVIQSAVRTLGLQRRPAEPRRIAPDPATGGGVSVSPGSSDLARLLPESDMTSSLPSLTLAEFATEVRRLVRGTSGGRN